MSLLVGAAELRALEEAENGLARPLATVRRIAVASVGEFAARPLLARLITRTLAHHRPGRILLTTPEWEQHPPVAEDRVDAAPPGLAARLRTLGPAWVGAPSLDDRFFDVAVADAGAVVDPPSLLRASDAVALVVPASRAQADAAVGLAEEATAAGRRVVVVFDASSGSLTWVRAVSPLLGSPAVLLRPDPAFVRPALPPRARTLLTVSRIAGALLTDPPRRVA